MTFTFEKERMTAVGGDGIPMGYITFPRVRPGLVNINTVLTYPKFRGQGVAGHMMDALLNHLDAQNQKAALTCPYAQQYVATHDQWKHILPGQLHFTSH